MTPAPLPEDHALAELLPSDRPCSVAEALDLGLGYRQLKRLRDVGLVRRRFKAVYQRVDVPDAMPTRLAALKLAVPDGCVVTDRTAGWLWAGDRMLAPNEHLSPQPLSVFCRPGYRLRNEETASGERTFAAADLVELDGLVVATPLRTACDLGRVLPRDQAFAALDTLLRVGAFTHDQMLAEVSRFKGMRGVIQLRSLSPLADRRSDSQFESILRLRWYDAGLPAPELQVEVPTPWGASYLLDLGLEEERFAAEYDGEAFHGPQHEAHDIDRRSWLTGERDWTILVFRSPAVVGPRQNAATLLTAAWRDHRAGRPPRHLR